MALLIKKSKLPGAGKGLFTNKAIPKDTKIIEYRGEIIGYNEFHRRARKEKDHYIFYLRREKIIDAFPTPQYKARYANDAEGISRVKGIKNNSEYQVHDDKCYIVSTRDIKSGEEILVDYTKHYWGALKKRK